LDDPQSDNPQVRVVSIQNYCMDTKLLYGYKIIVWIQSLLVVN
jgi:hypothetical protein